MPVATAKSQEHQRATDLRERAEQAAQHADEDFLRVMGETWGRRFVWRLLASTDGRAVLFNTNATQCASYAALRDFGRRELTDRGMALCPELWLEMHRENR